MLAPHSLEVGIFARHALQLRAHGLAVLPATAAGKVPSIKGWRKWRWPPSTKTIERFAQRFPEANVAIVPGPSGVFVVDVDNADPDEVEDLFGKTPLHVKSGGRGPHLYYRHVEGCETLPDNLRGIGRDVDLKAGNSIVIAPPSQHESGAVYRLDGCSWEALRDLPPPNLGRLRKLLEKRAPQAPQARRGALYPGRGLALNRWLCRHAASAEKFDDLLDIAKTFSMACIPPLDDDAEVLKRTRAVWKDAEAGKIQLWVGKSAVARSTDSEIDELCALGRNGSDAYMLLMKLRMAHGARCARGETFRIMTEAMQTAQTLPGWHWKRIAAARDLLLEGGFIRLVTPHKSTGTGWLPAQYTLGESR
jgi:hypothetical protein